jgi:flagellar L-ring protein precursor FlgH
MNYWISYDHGRSRLGTFAAVTAGVLLLLLAVSLQAQNVAQSATLAPSPWASSTGGAAPAVGKDGKPVAPKGNVAQSSLTSYLQRVKMQASDSKAEPGSIWTENGRLARFSTDVRAMRPHDLISVVVQESLAASTDGTVKNSRASSASSQISSLIGALKAGNALQNLLNANAASALTAGGASATNSSLITTFGGQVVDVLPNGILVIEAARQVEFSQQTQTIVLRGLVRPEDISQQNQVLSTAISSLELEVKGKGIVNDSTYRQNPLVRLIERILVF